MPGRYGPVVLGHRVWWRPSAKGTHVLHRLHMCLGLRRHPRHGVTNLLGTTNEKRDAPLSMEPVSHRNMAAPSPKAARTARRAPEAGAPRRERVLLVSLTWGIKRVLSKPLLWHEAKTTPLFLLLHVAQGPRLDEAIPVRHVCWSPYRLFRP